MTPEEFRAIRRAAKLSQNDLALKIGISCGRTIRRWERGERKIPGPIEILMLELQDELSMPDVADGISESLNLPSGGFFARYRHYDQNEWRDLTKRLRSEPYIETPEDEDDE